MLFIFIDILDFFLIYVVTMLDVFKVFVVCIQDVLDDRTLLPSSSSLARWCEGCV